MKTTLKRVLSIALALVLIVGVLPMGAQAASDHICEDKNGDFQCDHKTNVGTKWNPIFVQCQTHFHNMQETTPRQEPTCGAVGHEAVMTCVNKDCNETTGGDEIPATGEHTGGVATCTTQAVCSTCGQPYGEVDSNAHQFAEGQAVCLNGCGTANSSYVAPKLIICENGYKKYEAAGTPNSNVSVAECLTCAGINGDHVKSIEINYEPVNLSVNDSFVLGAAGTTTTISFFTKAQTSEPTTEPTTPPASTTPPATSEPTTPPASTTTKYTVYYNVNVDETSKENKILRSDYPAGTSMATILRELALKDIKFPGLFQDWFYIEGWYLPNGAKADANDTNWGLHENIVLTAKWKQKYNYEVVLKLYTNGNTNTVVKVIDAFKYVQDDGKLSHTEVTNIAKEYIKPNNDAGLTVYGPFDASGWEQYSLYSNRLTNTEYVEVNKYGTTVVHAMVHNALINGSSSTNNKKADSSNPKTGDMIMVPAAVMGATVSALAVMFYLKKKRTV